MANEFRSLDSHSAEYFGDTRDYWWNADFLELMGKRLSLDRARDVLDVGCGVGHWGRLPARDANSVRMNLAHGHPLCVILSRRQTRPEAPMSAPQSTHENRLAHETSPYLLQHKSNPVDWWPWGPAALVEGRVGEGGGQMDVELLEQAQDITRPSGRDRRNCKQILENEVPADEPGDELSGRSSTTT